MHGRKCFNLIALSLALASCSANTLLKPDCHSCTVEEQVWKEFSWTTLEGKWKGSVENLRNERGQEKKAKSEKPAELSFVKAGQFLQGRTCASMPAEALVLNGLLWEQGKASSETREYEAFVPADGDKVAYGRVAFSKVNGKELCQFRRLGRVMGKNRLSLPTVSFSDRNNAQGGRSPASAGEQEISVEFLRFVTAPADRQPAAVKNMERPELILRIFKVATMSGESGRSEWQGTDEYIYRLWKTQ